MKQLGNLRPYGQAILYFSNQIKPVVEWPLYALYYQEQFPSEIKILYMVFSYFMTRFTENM